MRRTLHRVVGSILLLTLIIAGFSGGKAIGARLRHQSDDSLSPWIPGSTVRMGDKSAPSAPPEEVFASVLDRVQQDYVPTTGSEPITNARLTEGALGRMVTSLKDPNTVYLNPSQSRLAVDSLLGVRFGIGAELTVINSKSNPGDPVYSFLTIKSVTPNGPAERARLQTGDRITEINGRWIIAYPIPSESTEYAAEPVDSKSDEKKSSPASPIRPGISAAHAIWMLTSGTGKRLSLTVSRVGRSTTDQVVITTGKTTVPMVDHRQPAPGVTCLRLSGFNADEAEEVTAVLSRRQDWAAGLIIDLRQNSGGEESDKGSRLDGYQSALDLIRHVARKPWAGQIERKPKVRNPILVNETANGSVIATDLRNGSNRQPRIAVLIDGGTSNIAELAAAGMRDAGGAKLIGSRTFGDGVLSRLTVMKEGGAIKTVSAHLYTASGADLSGCVEPDISVDKSTAIGGPSDRPYTRAMSFVTGR